MSKTLPVFAGTIVLILPFVAQSDENTRTQEFAVSDREAYALTISVAKPERFQTGRIDVEVRDPAGPIVTKTLHPFDLDLSTYLKPRATGMVTVKLRAASVRLDQVDVKSDLAPIHLSKSSPVVIATLPNGTWEQAQPIELGQTIYGSADERPYVPVSSESAYSALVSGFQWFRFTAPAGEAKLAHFVLETPDRDVPPDVDVFEPVAEGGIVPYREGASAYTPEATQNYPGLTPFRTRIVHPGKTYYLRVAGNHPEYKLRTMLYPMPPYRDAQNAVIAGMDYLIALGDSWHANTPRRGSIALRNTMPHAEPQACIACHPTQFTVRGYLTAAKNGYPNHHPAQLRFLTERLANNPRPLYGQPDTNWARVIFSARTVASRVPVLLDMARTEANENFDARGINRGYADYLNLHYGNRKALADDEADGSMPMVSSFEIGLQSWQTYGLMARDFPGEAQWQKRRSEVQEEIAARPPANVIDLGWKITALSVIDRQQYRRDVEDLVRQLYSWQTETGQFPYAFDRTAAPSDFISYQALYALAMAGHRAETDPWLARTVAYALSKQRPDGSWQGDPVYKGFDTPFRDTQFAVMGLSQLYPYSGSKPAPGTATIRTGSLDQALADLDGLPSRPGEALRKEVLAILANSPWPLARSAAAAYLGTIGDAEAIVPLTAALGDPTKSVQRSAAEALRRIGMNQSRAVTSALTAALHSAEGRTRWGALRVLAQEFRNLTSDDALLQSVQAEVASDPMPQNRFQAAGALWRWYSWRSESAEARSSILNALARPLAAEHDASVRRGLIESVYNVLDENAGQLEAWERAMAERTDQQATEAAFHRVIAGQAEIIAANLESGNRELRIGLLTALWDFHLRHMAIPENNRQKVDVILPAFFSDYSAGVPKLHEVDFKYEPYAETAAFAYRATNEMHVTRLGNDTDLPRLFPDSGAAIERALLKCLDGADRELTMEAIKAGSVLGDAETTAFTSAMLRLLQSPDQEIRSTVRYVYAGNQR
ncbi:MAG TPA: HEAT repeat domain-containing protein, partial [Bryobacteraceae bacterium]|nr:HEAT repeat domain-containing protein [Bryobacteraceae bacterium]